MKRKAKLEKEIKKLANQYFKTIADNDHCGFLYQELIQRVDRELIKTVMTHTNNNQSQTAAILGMSRTTLRKKLASLSLD